MEKAARILKEEKSNILAEWEAQVRAKIPTSAQTASLVLRDHMPQLLDDMERLMLSSGTKAALFEEFHYKDISRHGVEHGRHRASTASYTVDQILREYVIFHRIIVKLLLARGVYSMEAATLVQFSIESSMFHSAGSYNEALQEMRQKLLGILVHDMRNPISVALTALEIMHNNGAGEKFEQVREMADKSLKRAMNMMENLLDSVSIEAGQGMHFEFDQGNLVRSIMVAYKEAHGIYPERIRLKNNYEEIPGVFDGTMVHRALENLFNNAVKYGSSNTPITLEVEDSEEEVRLKVNNFGNPISEEQQKEILRFLHTTNRNRQKELKSWGMGLTLVQAVANAHGGELRVESGTEGTTFTLALKKFHNEPGKKRVTLNFA